ncbi:hypothetical protein F0U62_49635 [Cystobacter fuscus]|uniref:hypothetical protein n=1 Tax=Cystobacter fuscus TaxID=43 RepID=UPI002B2D87A1|nr:hypothetical protein F0U62_49635 [Cystobacter fuscus]
MKNLPSALLISFLVLFLQVLAIRSWLGRDIISRTLQFLFYGPLLVADSLLGYAQSTWGLSIETTMFGGFPEWLDMLLLVLNWLLCSLFYFGVWKLVTRARAQD